MANRPPHNPHDGPLEERARRQNQEQRYVNDGQFLNQGYYEDAAARQNAEQQAQNQQEFEPNPEYNQHPEYNPHAEFNPQDGQIDANATDSAEYNGSAEYSDQAEYDGSGYLRPEFVQGNEYQQYHEEPQIGQGLEGEELHQMSDDGLAQNIGSIATFGNQEVPVSNAPNKLSPIIPRGTIIGKSILFIIIAMCFLASLSIVSLLLVQSSVDGWTADIGRQATVQIIPNPERDVEADIATALEIIRATNGVALAEPLTRNETGKLLEPWIGDGIIGKDDENNDIFILDELPIPALIAIEFMPDQVADLNLLDISLKAAIPGISVDDHKKWLSHLSSIGNILKISAFAVLSLVVAITITIIIFATDAALNSNKSSIEILFLVGAEEAFITKEVRHHFLWLGLKAGVIGAGICIGFILLLSLLINIIYAAQFDNLAAARILFGQVALSPYQYIYLLLVPIFATLIAGTTVHLAAKRIINSMH